MKPAILGGEPAFREPWGRYVSTGPREAEAAQRVMAGGLLSGYVGAPGPHFFGGPEVRALDAEWARAFSVMHALSVSSATAGLHAALVAAGVKPGTEVIVPAQTMSATVTMITLAGGTPVFCDQLEETSTIDPRRVRELINERTRAVFAVNLFGGPAEVHELRRICDEHGVILIEDNAQSPGGRKAGQLLGTVGHLGVFSLNCHKVIQCGEGGVVVTDDDRLARRVHLVRNHGENAAQGDEAEIVGTNYRLTELQAAIARVQLERLEELTAPRIAVANALREGLARFPAIRTARVLPGDRHVYYVFPMWLDPAAAGISRDRFAEALRAEGCTINAGYVKPLYRLPLYQRPGAARITPCPNAERAHHETFLCTPLIEVPGALEKVPAFVHAVEKILRHAEELEARACA